MYVTSGPPRTTSGLALPEEIIIDLPRVKEVLNLLDPGVAAPAVQLLVEADGAEDVQHLLGAALDVPLATEGGEAIADLGEIGPIVSGVGRRVAHLECATRDEVRDDLGDLADLVVLLLRAD